ncbi:glycosyltransferase 87 family protein [Sphingomonas sp. LHG3406-1]|uniref:glycosyltransferase 87 family protein n=1 Tax=Sphingomonas sp. LHG3406-1 TaxID=2804617 RepID=UPI002629A672|nr:glycosyltransferase 87 family protein [Sphingomonas sp. LHG3406-1]
MGEMARTRWLLAGLGLLFVAAALSAPINHDESQYVAAIAMMREGLPYRDWPYLQTPLQPLLLSPLSLLPAGWLLVGARLANVLFALVTCWALMRFLADRVPYWVRVATVVGLATTNAFLFGTEVARNDMLPAALLALGLLAILPNDMMPHWRRTGIAGLCFGLAISAKISMALPVAGAGLWMLLRARRLGWPALAAAAAGGLAGILPSIALYALSPERFTFGVLTYSLIAPQLYWTGVGEAWRLQPLGKLGGIAEQMIKGAPAVALLLTLVTLRRRARQRLLEIMAVGGLIAAFLPDPFFKQYLVPLLPPLFARAGIALPTLEQRWRHAALAAGALCSLYGVAGTILAISKAVTGASPLWQAVERGRAVAAAADGGTVVTLAPEQFVGVDVELHPGFTAGPFLYRIEGEPGRFVRRVTEVPTFESLHLLDVARPAVVVTGGERKQFPPELPLGLDGPLDQWAGARGYRKVELPGTAWWMWIAPTQKGGPEGPPSGVTLP